MNMMLLKPGTEDTSTAEICNVLNQNKDKNVHRYEVSGEKSWIFGEKKIKDVFQD